MIPISIVVSAPFGIDRCLFPDDLLAQVDGLSLEIIVADGAPDYVDRSRPGFRHLGVGSPNPYKLKTVALLNVTKEWVLVSEDHARPLPGILAAYREAIQHHPDIDLFSGTMDNLTSTSPWSLAFFLYGDGHNYWSLARKLPRGASTANLMIRRSAILAPELASDYGFFLLTIDRLVQAGRHRHCANAIVDHFLPLNFPQAMKKWFWLAERSTLARRKTRPPRPLLVQAMRDCAGLIYLPTLGAWRTALTLRGTPYFNAPMCLRLMMIGLANAAGVISTDIKRLLGAV